MNPMRLFEATPEQRVKEKWPTAHIARSQTRSLYAVYIGAATMKGGNGRKRRSGWHDTESFAWSDAATRLAPEPSKEPK